MTEDEAFIRAIVASPGNDLPRLVYADWLDERSDPRGAYLRAECDAVVTGDIATLRRLAIGLDPVWVARVSVPPVGACLAHIEFDSSGTGASEEQVEARERHLGVTFPAEYRAFLRNYNGCRVTDGASFEAPSGEIIRLYEDISWRLFQLDKVERFAVRADDFLQEDYGLPPLTESVESWLARHVCIGRDPDWIGTVFLCVAGPGAGHVHIIDTSVEVEAGIRRALSQPPLASTFAEFLARLPVGYGTHAEEAPPPVAPNTGSDLPF